MDEGIVVIRRGLEERVGERLLRGQPLVGVDHKEPREEVDGGRRDVAKAPLQRVVLLALVVRREADELLLELELLALLEVRDADDLEDVEEDHRRVVAVEDRLGLEHLRHDDACGPDVDGRAVHAELEEELRRAVVLRDGGLGVPAVRDVDGAAHAKVAELRDAVRDEDVRRLDVAVDDAVRVEERKRLEDLGREALDCPVRDGRVRLDVVEQVAVAVLKDQVQRLGRDVDVEEPKVSARQTPNSTMFLWRKCIISEISRSEL